MTVDFVLIDIGNTATKLHLATRDRLLGRPRRLPTAALLAPGGGAAFKTMLNGWHPRRIVFSSVVPAATRVALTALPDALPVSPALETGVDLRGYPGRNTLGADRLANLAGALALYGPPPLIVVDLGTAATFNALDARGRFLGGSIAPGLSALRDYLPARGAQLPSVPRLTGATPPAIGRRTTGAVRAGIVLGFRGLVREILDALRAELGGGGRSVRVVATGGDARWLAARLPAAIDIVAPDLTFQGLRIIASHLRDDGSRIPPPATRNGGPPSHPPKP